MLQTSAHSKSQHKIPLALCIIFALAAFSLAFVCFAYGNPTNEEDFTVSDNLVSTQDSETHPATAGNPANGSASSIDTGEMLTGETGNSATTETEGISPQSEEDINALIESNYPTNLTNGSFEEPDKHTGTSDAWKGVLASEVPSWNTTASNNKIEFGWVTTSGSTNTSPHMKESEATARATAADGYCFAEVVADEKNSSLYHTYSLTPGAQYNFSFAHRGRAAEADTVAMIVGPVQAYSFDKKAVADSDPFSQMISWLKESTDVSAPKNGKATQLVVYSTKLSSQGTFDTSVVDSPFSSVSDENYTEEWHIYLCSSTYDQWNTFKGTFTAPSSEVIMAFSSYKSSYTNKPETAGNLLDAITLTDKLTGDVITNTSFEVDISANYTSIHSGSDSIDGWCTTAFLKNVEIGCLKNGNAYGLPDKTVSSVYVRDGEQFAELNADEESTLYQYISTGPGKKYEWSLSHRGRSGVDTMALVIGPKQQYDPKKTSKTSRDQLMQMVDWIKNQSDIVIEGLTDEGCSEKLILFSAPFNDSGGFDSDDPFSWSSDDVHTEKWTIWVISSDNKLWCDYGYIDPNLDATYDYSYIVPEGATESLFGFVSFQPATKSDGSIDYTYGNLLDCISFDEYYHVRGATTANGEGQIVMIDKDPESFEVNNDYIGWALSESSFQVVSQPVADRAFIGAIINGAFVPASEWTHNEEADSYSYTISGVNEHYDIRLVFAAQHIIYDVNGGNPYHYIEDDSTTGYEVKLMPGEHYTSHAATSSTDGWRFSGWRYTNTQDGSTVFDSAHTISFVDAEEGNDDYLEITGNEFETENKKTISNIPSDEGITMVAQWQYRQRFATQLWNPVNNEVVFSKDCGSIIYSDFRNNAYSEDFQPNGEKVGEDFYVSDKNTNIEVTTIAKEGYRFIGWFDANGNQVSQSRFYGYLVDNRQVSTLYARFVSDGFDLTVGKSVTGDYGDTNAYFKIGISVKGAWPNSSYHISVPDSRQITPLEGGLVMSDSILHTDESGNGTATVYLKHGQEATIFSLPAGTIYSVQERNYEDLAYKSSYELDGTTVDPISNVTLQSDATANVINTCYTYNLQVEKNGLSDASNLDAKQPLSNVGFTLYSDSACTKVTHAQKLTDDAGLTDFAGLKVGSTYYLKETLVPTGYDSTGEAYILKVKPDGIYLVKSGTETKLEALADSESTYKIALTNATMITLPSSGSFITPHTMGIFGLFLISYAVLLTFQKVRAGRNDRKTIQR